ncbi:MAG: MCE family protein [Alphaproteobacteria bacterium]|nr:MCE family protein [Alphaproteobacteria bacterium]
METKANYVAVGGFVLACIIGVVATLLWLAGAQYNEQYDYYQTYFNGPVTGLGKGTTVRYNGIEVGHIQDLKFDPADPQRVIVTLEVQQGLNIRVDSEASIESQGLTGGNYVEITGGKATSPLLEPQPGQRYAVIKSKPSAFQQLEQTAPQILAKLNVAADRVNDLLSEQNRRALSGILSNLDQMTATLNARAGDVATTLHNLSVTSAHLAPLITDADADMDKFGKFSSDADALVKSPALSDLSDLTADIRRLLKSLTRLSDQLDRDPTKLLFGDRRKGYSPDGK